MSIQGSVNQVIGSVAAFKTAKEFQAKQATKIQRNADAEKMKEANANAAAIAKAKQEQDIAKNKLFEEIRNYPTGLGNLKDLAPQIQKAVIEQSPELQAKIKESMKYTEDKK